MRVNHKTLFLLSSLPVLLLIGCRKYLDKKPDVALTTIETAADLQSLLDNVSLHNLIEQSSDEISSDNYYLTDERWSSLANQYVKRMYLWEKDRLFNAGTIGNEWLNAYKSVYYANTVLDNIEKVRTNGADATELNNIKGQAFFFRGKQHFHVAVLWANGYDANTAGTEMGIPYRSSSDFNETSDRSNLQLTLEKVTADLKQAAALLPNNQVNVYRPSKPAAYGFLSRVYLYMRKYTEAKLYADSCLQLRGQLLDYNTLSSASNTPFVSIGFNNPEIIWENTAYRDVPVGGTTRGIIDTFLYRSYVADDLRKGIFFRQGTLVGYVFKGNYDEILGGNLFSGVAVDEVYLNRAEALARLGNKDDALVDLNALMIKRWKNTVTYTPITATDAADALNKILVERRKELLFRNLRWMDIKRLNKEGANISLKRIINGQTYTLVPDDPRFALPIPEDIISLTGMPQNPR